MITCAGCGKPIRLAYLKALRKNWHVDCFRCAGCNLPVRDSSFKTKDGKPYHTACYQAVFNPLCPTCGLPVAGASIQALGHMYHPEHFVCAACGKLIRTRQFHTHNKKPYCKQDYVRLFSPPCSICGKPISGTFRLDAQGNKVCSKRDRAHKLCSSCGRALFALEKIGGKHFAAGHTVCNICLASAVSDQAEAIQLFKEISLHLESINLHLPYQQIPLKMVSMAELRKNHLRNSSLRPNGLTLVNETSLLGKSVNRQVSAILVLTSLPKIHLGMVLAHEAMHAWLFLNSFSQLPPRVEEGLCELVASLWLEKQTDPLAQHLLAGMQTNRSRNYGSGYRAARKVWKKYGLSQLLDMVKKNKTLPR